jgi:transposase
MYGIFSKANCSRRKKRITVQRGVARLVGIECGVVSGVINLESSGVEALDWRPRHDEHYHEA